MQTVEPQTRQNPWTQYAVAVAVGLAYGLFMRFVHGGPQSSSVYTSMLVAMTAGFLIVGPFVIGWLTVAALAPDREYHFGTWIFLPWLAVLLANVLVWAANIEGLICIVFALPITLVFSSLGGITAGLIRRDRYHKMRSFSVCLAILPFLLSAAEMQTSGPRQLRTVNTAILIHATPAAIWPHIERVAPIAHGELRPTWAHAIGFPLPVEATLDHEGLGGIRHASFEHGLLFIETIDGWDPGWRIAFTIAADTAHIPPTTLDEHVTIGGRYFDVLDGEYRLEPLPHGDTMLHLSSRERLSTDFNFYAALWSDAVMSNLQTSILEVVKHRAEADVPAVASR